jgi:predicted transcriptional regulator
MNKSSEIETKQQNQLNLSQDLILEKTFQITHAIIQAKGTTFSLNSRVVLETLNNVHTQVTNFMNIACGAKNPAVSIEESITPGYIICLEDGAKVKMLRKYLRSRYNMSPEQYIRKWNLPRGYPMVAPDYSKQRQRLAIQTKLGHSSEKGSRRSKDMVKTATKVVA